VTTNIALFAAYLLLACDPGLLAAELSLGHDLDREPSSQLLGGGGQRAHYKLEQPKNPPKSTVIEFMLLIGPNEPRAGGSHQWIELEASKANGKQFRVW
jgi:hypothetical protein